MVFYFEHLFAASVLCLWCTLTVADDLATCLPHDFHYEYTECDSQGGRWRVSVPEPGKCVGGAPNPPLRGKGCDFTCSDGQYLDIQGEQECKPCPAGTYSLGGGVRFDDWEKLPSGFAVKIESFSGPGYMAGLGFSERSSYHHGPKTVKNCTGTGWQANGKTLSVQGEEDCYAILTYTANLVQAGDVRFTYQYTDKNTLFQFQVKNNECENVYDHNSNKYLHVTEEGDWQSTIVRLKSGLNILTWKVFALDTEDGQGLRKPVMIKNIELMGIAYTSECMKCPAGSSSAEGASECDDCKAGTSSKKGATTCTPCDPVTQYSEEGASECITRPACSVNDYYSYNSPCDGKNMTQKTYSWIKPKVCSDTLAGSVKLPAPSNPEACPPCNPGMETKNGSCQFCPSNHHSDGSGKCQPCPGSTAPETSIQYKWWNNMPHNANLTAYCLSLTDRGCASKEGWQPSLEYMHSGRGHADDVYLVLSLKVGGFRGKEQVVNGESAPVAEITFVFGTECAEDCSFIFMQQTAKGGTSIINVWEKSQLRQAFSYKVVSTKPVSFIWAFQKRDPEEVDPSSEGSFKLKNDRALIYAINVTNTLDGGASACKTCPKGIDQEECIPCSPGQFLNPDTQQCAQCPANTIARGYGGQDGCVACGTGLHTTDNVRCVTECKLTSDGKDYDFTSLAGVQTVEGTRLFTSGGTQYYHIFNISLCAGSPVQCADNITFPGEEDEADKHTMIESAVCRSTIIPPVPGDDGIMSAQPVSLGDSLVNITGNGSSLNMAQRMKEEGFQYDEDNMDMHFVYVSDMPTAACLDGRTTIITLRCDPTQVGTGTIQLPPKCSDGTCDGCHFHLLWYSKKACPVCKKDQFQEIPGECVNGKQNITIVPPKHCILVEDSKLKSKQQPCSVKWPTWLTVVVYVVPVLVILVIFFIVIAIYCCMKNRNLEYKYMLLAASSNNRDGNYDQLPAAETCALEDGEEEEQFDAVQFKENKGRKFFGKLKGMGGKKKMLLENLKSFPLTMGFQKSKKYGEINPEQEELFSEEEEINTDDKI